MREKALVFDMAACGQEARMSRGWLSRVLGPPPGAGRSTKTRTPLPRLWAVRPAIDASTRQHLGADVRVGTTEGVRFGHLCLLVERGGLRVDALAVVLGEPGRSKGQAYTRDAVVTKVFAEPIALPAPLGRSTRAAPVDPQFLSEVDTLVPPSEWTFLERASRNLKPDEYAGHDTLEKASERLVVELLRESGFERVETQVPIPGSSDTSNRRLAELTIDVLGCWLANGKRHFLVVEGKWRNVGGSQAAAQAYEYARRIKSPDARAAGRTVFNLDVHDVKDDVVHALVVANRVTKRSDAAKKLGVPRMTYVRFAQLLGRREHEQLPIIDDATPQDCP